MHSTRTTSPVSTRGACETFDSPIPQAPAAQMPATACANDAEPTRQRARCVDVLADSMQSDSAAGA